MIKVLKIVRAIPGIPDAGGAENVCWEIAKSHKEKGLDVELLIPFNGNTFSKENIKI